MYLQSQIQEGSSIDEPSLFLANLSLNIYFAAAGACSVLTDISSISKTNVELAGIVGVSCSPYASSGGITTWYLEPTFIN